MFTIGRYSQIVREPPQTHNKLLGMAGQTESTSGSPLVLFSVLQSPSFMEMGSDVKKTFRSGPSIVGEMPDQQSDARDLSLRG
jgi:hypothetical protein